MYIIPYTPCKKFLRKTNCRIYVQENIIAIYVEFDICISARWEIGRGKFSRLSKHFKGILCRYLSANVLSKIPSLDKIQNTKIKYYL